MSAGPIGCCKQCLFRLIADPDGKVYIAGENHLSNTSHKFPDRKYGLPPDPRDVPYQIDRALIDRITRTAKVISPALDVDNGARVVRAEVCSLTHRPGFLPSC
jgi:hypothetical protein